MDKALLPMVTPAFFTVQPEILLEHFIKTVEEQANITHQNSETLLIMIFGHGRTTTCKIMIRGNRRTKEDRLLPIESLKGVIKDTDVTLLLPSCFSGRWLLQPSFSMNRHLNPGKETPWNISKSLGRAFGASVAMAILDWMIEFEEQENWASSGSLQSTLGSPKHNPAWENRAAGRRSKYQEDSFSAPRVQTPCH